MGSRLPREIEFSILDQLDWTQHHTAALVCKGWRDHVKRKPEMQSDCYHRWSKPARVEGSPEKSEGSPSPPRGITFLQSSRGGGRKDIYVHQMIYEGGLAFNIRTTPDGGDADFGQPRELYVPAMVSSSFRTNGEGDEAEFTLDGTPYRRLRHISYLNDIIFLQAVSSFVVDCFSQLGLPDKNLDLYVSILRFTINKTIPKVLTKNYTIKDFLNLVRDIAIKEVRGFWSDPVSLLLVLNRPVLMENGRVFLSIGVMLDPS